MISFSYYMKDTPDTTYASYFVAMMHYSIQTHSSSEKHSKYQENIKIISLKVLEHLPENKDFTTKTERQRPQRGKCNPEATPLFFGLRVFVNPSKTERDLC